MQNLKEQAIRGGLAKVCAQAANFILRTGSLMVLARLLDPKDFGLVGMVTAIIGVLNLFRDFGLSTATVQRETVTDEQISTLFWVNMLVGVMLAFLSLAFAPLIARFYHEPRLAWITAVLAAGFVFNAAGVQHSALLQRQMRFAALSIIDTIAQLVSIAVGISMAMGGYGYWALVWMSVTLPVVSTIGLWSTAAWVPGMAHRQIGIRSIIRFGGTITLNSLVIYVAYNFEKVLLGRYWGANAIGIYGRAYQLINIPTENLNSATGGVAFAALSRIQDDPGRLKSYFLKGYSLVLGLTIPITFFCCLFSDDLISVLLGSKWNDAAPIFRLLAPTIMIFAMINPLSWLLFATGRVMRSLKVALVLSPVVIIGYIIGLPHGPKGVALGYSISMIVWAVPHIAWCVKGTPIGLKDIFIVLSKPFLSGTLAASFSFAIQILVLKSCIPLQRLVIGGAVFICIYIGMLFWVMGQGAFYLGLIRGLRERSPLEESTRASA